MHWKKIMKRATLYYSVRKDDLIPNFSQRKPLVHIASFSKFHFFVIIHFFQSFICTIFSH